PQRPWKLRLTGPPLAPEVGVKATDRFSVAPGASVGGVTVAGSNTYPFVVSASAPVMLLTVTLPVFLSWNGNGTDAPTTTPPKSWLAGIVVNTPCWPVQLSATSIVLLENESETIRKLPLRLSCADGRHAIIHVVLCVGGSVTPETPVSV